MKKTLVYISLALFVGAMPLLNSCKAHGSCPAYGKQVTAIKAKSV